MNQSELLFKFPYKMYTQRDWAKVKKEEEENINLEIDNDLLAPNYAIGWEYVFIDEIIGWSSSFSYPRSIEDVKELGADLTTISLKNGKDLVCLWDVNKFIIKYDNHINKIKEFQAKNLQDETENKVKNIKKLLEDNLVKIMEEYKSNGIHVSEEEILSELT